MSLAAGARRLGWSDGQRDLAAPNGATDIAAILWQAHDAVLETPDVAAALDRYENPREDRLSAQPAPRRRGRG
ncbi:MAG: hypothetical protein WDN06_18040 [Asticcacaulis sp.]